MGKLPYAKSYRDLIVYQKAKLLARDIYQMTVTLPREETYSLVDQIRRSSRSIGAQIAEAWAKRRYTRHFISKLTDAEGEQLETQHWIDIAADCGYLNDELAKSLRDRCAEIGRLIGSMTAKADLFCGSEYKTVRETTDEYFYDNDDSQVV